MKKVININFQGRVIPIEEAAYDILKQYVDSLRRFFINEEGRDEIINDIEGRIAELFGEVLKKGSTCITDDDVEAIIKSMGRPEDFDDDEANVQSQLGGEKAKQSSFSASSSTSNSSGFTNRGFTATTAGGRFYRDENQKVIAGVCSGIAKYFGIDPLVVRIIFIICAFAGFGFGFVVYFVLWVAVPSTASTVIGSVKKRLFRDPDSKLIAGVCSGLSNYFGVNLWIPRVLFIIPFFSFVSRWSHWGAVDFPSFLTLTFSPAALLIYIILWLVLPEALTTSEKLEMKGERVDLNSIKNTIQGDMEGFKDRAEKFGKEVGEKAQQLGKEFGERGKQFGYEASHIAKRGGSGVGNVIGLLIKGLLYFIIGTILFFLIVGLFIAGITISGLMPLKTFLIADGWQNMFVWGALILFIWVPVIGTITWIIRRLAKMRNNSRTIRFTFVALWLVGLFCFVGLISTLIGSFKYRNHSTPETIAIPTPKVAKLEVKGIFPVTDDNDYWFHIEPFRSVDGDTAFARNSRIRLTLSDNDSFTVTVRKFANGSTREEANELASKIPFQYRQRDTILWINNFVAFSEKEKFRNQLVEITIGIPKNGRIRIDESAKGWGLDEHFFDFGRDWDNNYSYNENDERKYEYDFDRDVDYIMTSEGKLKRLHPVMEDNDNNDDNNNNDNNSNNVKPNNGNAADSNTYHYNPGGSKPKAPIEPKKPVTPKKDTVPAKQAQTKEAVKNITAIPAIFIARFTI